MMIAMMLIWVLVIAGVVWLVWRAIRGRSGGGGSRGESAEEVLKRRYARDEIDRSSYERMLADLRGGSGAP